MKGYMYRKNIYTKEIYIQKNIYIEGIQIWIDIYIVF